MNGSSGWSLKVGSLLGIPIRVHFTFLLLLFWFGALVARSASAGAALVVFFAGLLVSVVLHELGHAIMGRRFGIDTREIVLTPVGGLAKLDSVPVGATELAIAIAGPVVNLLIAVALTPLVLAMGGGLVPQATEPTMGSVIGWLQISNLMLFAFNMIPAFPLDGGRLLRSGLTFFMSTYSATRVATRLGQALALFLLLLAVFAPAGMVGQNLLLLLVALFIFLGASQESNHQQTLTLLSGRSARDAMQTRFESLAPQDTVEQAARLLLGTPQRDFPVVDGWGRAAGLLSRENILELLSSVPPQAPLLEVMSRDVPRVETHVDLVEIVRRLQGSGGGTLLVEEGERLVGMITLDKLGELVEVVRRLRGRSGVTE